MLKENKLDEKKRARRRARRRRIWGREREEENMGTRKGGGE
jgi:hypothetical protein